jgi:hypothetical protein
MAVSNPASFRAEARWQRVCAVCGAGGRYEGHHVVPKQLLRRLKLPLHDPRNALRLCPPCHDKFEPGGVYKLRIDAKCLTDANMCYLWETLGTTVVQLERKYSSIETDPRWVKHRMGECEACQLSQPM